jgi:glutamate/aspartate transport system substrate-binding protein
MRTLFAAILIGALLTTPLSAQELQGTLKDIQDSGKMRIGYRHSLPPMSFLSNDGIPIGYSMDICNHIVTNVQKKIGKDISVEYIPVTAENRFDALVTNKIDILCGAATTTLARREVVDFSNLIFVTGGSYMALKGRKVENNFDGKKIGVEKGTTTAEALKDLFKDTGTQVEMVLLNSKDEGISALKKGEIDILSADQVVLIGLLLKDSNPNQFIILPDMFSYDPIALAVRRNDADFRLIADRTLSNLYESGQIDTIYQKWFGQFSPTMPSALQALIKLNVIPEK